MDRRNRWRAEFFALPIAGSGSLGLEDEDADEYEDDCGLVNQGGIAGLSESCHRDSHEDGST
jgi:hypothetical protein